MGIKRSTILENRKVVRRNILPFQMIATFFLSSLTGKTIAYKYPEFVLLVFFLSFPFKVSKF